MATKRYWHVMAGVDHNNWLDGFAASAAAAAKMFADRLFPEGSSVSGPIHVQEYQMDAQGAAVALKPKIVEYVVSVQAQPRKVTGCFATGTPVEA